MNWISVNERLPVYSKKERNAYLVSWNDGSKYVDIGYLDDDLRFKDFHGCHGLEEFRDDPTHWMPLPNAPSPEPVEIPGRRYVGLKPSLVPIKDIND